MLGAQALCVIGMRSIPSVLIILLALAVPAAAQQPAVQTDSAACASDIATLTRDMDAARTKGQMLRRQQLANELAALHARCEQQQHATETDRVASIQKLEQQIKELRAQLAHAEEELRKLKSDAP